MARSSVFRRESRDYLWAAVLILLVASALRLPSMGKVPPGLYHDEAYNGLDALHVLEGDFSLYYEANNGREPMFVYLIALWVGLLGRSPVAVRWAAFFPGLLTVATTVALGRTLFGRRIGLLSAAVLSVTLWHIHLSRVGFRAVLLPLFIALTLWQIGLGVRTERRGHWRAAGVLYGLGYYTYMAARFTPIPLALVGLYLVSTRPDWRTRDRLISGAWFGLALGVTLLPLVIYTILHPEVVLGRAGQVSIWNPDIHGGDFWGTLLQHGARTAGMFFVQGDRIWRHNLAWRPVFDPLLGALFLVGLGRALKRFRTSGAMALLIIWTAAMTLPTWLAEDAPHFLRAVGVLLVVFFPALGIEWLSEKGWAGLQRFHRSTSALGERHRTSTVRIVGHALRFIPALILLIALTATATDYFGVYASADMTAYWFEAGAETMAGRINAFLGSGWDGDRMQHGSSGDQRVFVEQELWQNWTSMPFTVGESAAVQLLPPDLEWPVIEEKPMVVFLWPYGDWRRVWSMLKGPAEIRVERGALSQGDRDLEPYTTYCAFYIMPSRTPTSALARFQGGAELVDATLQTTNQGVHIALSWYAKAPLVDDLTVFVHIMRDGQRIAQDDDQPTGGYYPTSRWRSGDIVHDDHFVQFAGQIDPQRDQVLVGLYRPEDSVRLDVLDEAGNAAGTFVTLPVVRIMQ
jgi:4-amino-4-deoxy-L-arabinose transferase-like glycosyltransferase